MNVTETLKRVNDSTITEEEERGVLESILNEYHQIHNAITLSRTLLADSLEGENRDINKECGYPATSNLTVAGYYLPFYRRHAIAARVVEMMPMECWRTYPDVFEDEEAKKSGTKTKFDQSWENLSVGMSGDSKFKRKEGSPLWEYLRRVDICSGIGEYGIIFLGLSGPPDERMEDDAFGSTEQRELKYLRVFDQSVCRISRYETDRQNPRYGLPTEYNIDIASPITASSGNAETESKTISVHWSRVIHVAEDLENSEFIAIPRMRPVFNRLWDLRKLYGGSAEMYWKGAFPGLSFETHPHLGAASSVSVEGLREQIQKYQQGLQRYLSLKGMTAKSLAPQIVDPSNEVEMQIDAICIQKGWPKRIFLGSERGELSSSQDDETWVERVGARQSNYLTPRVVAQLVDRLIQLRVLEEPSEYFVEWPDLAKQSDLEKATVAVKATEAMAKYVGGDVEEIIQPTDYFVEVMGWDEEKANTVVDNASKHMEEVGDKELEREIEIQKQFPSQPPQQQELPIPVDGNGKGQPVVNHLEKLSDLARLLGNSDLAERFSISAKQWDDFKDKIENRLAEGPKFEIHNLVDVPTPVVTVEQPSVTIESPVSVEPTVNVETQPSPIVEMKPTFNVEIPKAEVDITVQSLQGEKGERGDTGEVGPKGDKGDPSEIKVEIPAPPQPKKTKKEGTIRHSDGTVSKIEVKGNG